MTPLLPNKRKMERRLERRTKQSTREPCPLFAIRQLKQDLLAHSNFFLLFLLFSVFPPTPGEKLFRTGGEQEKETPSSEERREEANVSRARQERTEGLDRLMLSFLGVHLCRCKKKRKNLRGGRTKEDW